MSGYELPSVKISEFEGGEALTLTLVSGLGLLLTIGEDKLFIINTQLAARFCSILRYWLDTGELP